jgi:hypothetical protein
LQEVSVEKLPYVRQENIFALCTDMPQLATASAAVAHLMGVEAAPPFLGA